MPEVIDRYRDLTAGLTSSDRLKAKSRIYEVLGSGLFSTACDEERAASAPVYLDCSHGAHELCYEPAGLNAAKVKLMSQLNALYADLDNRTTCVLVGTTGTVTFSEAPSSPSAYPKFVSGYINQLQIVNRRLETRVQNLESRLSEVQKYLPTIKRLVHEHGSALGRVSSVMTQLSRKYDPAEAWKIAKKKDVLQAPLPEEYSEIV